MGKFSQFFFTFSYKYLEIIQQKRKFVHFFLNFFHLNYELYFSYISDNFSWLLSIFSHKISEIIPERHRFIYFFQIFSIQSINCNS